MDVSAEIVPHECFDLLYLVGHGGENGTFRFVKAVVGCADHMETLVQQGQHMAEIPPPMAAGAGKQHQDGRVPQAGFMEFHTVAPFVQVKQAMPFTVSIITSVYRASSRFRRLSSVSKGGVKYPLGT